jgi:sugar transferase EpsL
MKQHGWPLALKRTIDVFVAGATLVMASPVLVAAATTIVLTDGRPIFFRQMRPGRDTKPFRLVKFRTMRNDLGEARLDLDHERLTPIGRVLRRTSIDELPQLWNVLRGDMSLVGPRPLLMRYLSRYTKEQARRHEVLPGITGWAAVNGRNALSWDQKFALDNWYVDHWTPWLDFRIIVKTVRRVLAASNVSSEGYATSPEFLGSTGR